MNLISYQSPSNLELSPTENWRKKPLHHGASRIRIQERPDEELEKLRLSYRPKRVLTLFVGESPLPKGVFFYNRNNSVYRGIRQVYGAGVDSDFLAQFKARGHFYDDLMLYPINQVQDDNQRNEYRWKGVDGLTRRLINYRPLAIVVLMRAIEPMVVKAIAKSGLEHVPRFVTPFPGAQYTAQFQGVLKQLLVRLPTYPANRGL